MNNVWNCLKMFLLLTVITGIIYPLIITGIAQIAVKQKANGSFIFSNGKIIGAELIGQKFENNKYFWSRPSATEYNPLPSGGSNWGPTSSGLKQAVEKRRKVILNSQEVAANSQIPSELLFASGSGLDPHISVKAAQYQIPRIIKARGWDEDKSRKDLTKLIDQLTEKSLFSLLSPPYINVLKLNLALDELSSSYSSSSSKISHLRKHDRAGNL